MTEGGSGPLRSDASASCLRGTQLHPVAAVPQCPVEDGSFLIALLGSGAGGLACPIPLFEQFKTDCAAWWRIALPHDLPLCIANSYHEGT